MKFLSLCICGFIYCFYCSGLLFAQNYTSIKVVRLIDGNETNNALFKVASSIPSLSYIRAQRIEGPQDGIFTQNGDNIRYISISSVSGIPGNLSRIRFTFLQADRKTLIPENSFKFIINDIDGPDNEALATNCNANLSFLGTANPTNLMVVNLQPNILAIGTVEENDGPTSRVMFEFKDVSVIELDNYANDGYLKDFDMNDDYPISEYSLVNCKTYTSPIKTQNSEDLSEFKEEKEVLKINTKLIYFDRDKFNIRDDAVPELDKVVEIMKKYPKIIIQVQSHTDSRAEDDYNLTLSDARAKSSVAWILDKGIDSTRVTGKGFGETELVNNCSNNVKCTEDEHQQNRRTEFIVLNPDAISN